MTRTSLLRMGALAAALGLGALSGAALDGHAEAQRRAPAAAGATAAASGQHAARARREAADQDAETPARSADGVVNINTASEEELTRLPGIGASKAQAILAFRERVRRFRSPEDLMRVRGIGRATFRRLRPMLSVDGATTLGAAPATATTARTARAAAH